MASVDQEYGPVDKKLRFEDVKYNFLAAARHGLGAQFIWPGDGRLPAGTLILKHLLPLARAGLKSEEIAAEDIDRYLGTIEERVRRDQTGSHWAFRSLAALDGEGTRDTQHKRLTEAMLANQKTEKPVHTWELPQAGTGTKSEQTVQDIMSTDLFTVLPNATVQMVASVMDWRYVRQRARRGEEGRFCGLASHRDLLHVLAGSRSGQCSMAAPVREIMNASPATTSPDTPLAGAIELMRDGRSDPLPVVSGGRLVGIVTSQDVLAVLARMLHRGVLGEQGRSDTKIPCSHSDPTPRPNAAA